MTREMDRQYPYFETRSVSEEFTINPLVKVQLQYKEKETASDGENEVDKELRVVTVWPVKHNLVEFTSLYQDWLEQNQNHPTGDLSNPKSKQHSENLLQDKLCEAFIRGDSGSNLLDYEALVSQPVPQLKKEIESLEKDVDWGRLYGAEIDGQNRKTAKQWIHRQRTTAYPIRYQQVSFAYLQTKPFYPTRVSRLTFRTFMGTAGVTWRDSIGTYIPPFIAEKQPENEEWKDFQKKLDDKYSHLTLIHEYSPTEETDDETGEINLNIDRLRFFLKHTVPKELAKESAERNNLDDTETAIEQTAAEIKETAENKLRGFAETEDDLDAFKP